MYLRKIAELGGARSVYDRPLMPYIKALISAARDPVLERQRKRIVLQGDVPSPVNPPSGFRFHTRNPYVVAACKTVEPQLTEILPGHSAACIRISPAGA